MRWVSQLRKANALISVALLVLFVLHGIGNSFLLMLVGTSMSDLCSVALVVLSVVHAVIGIVLTVDAVRVTRSGSAPYVRLNARFWVGRISGLLIALSIVAHIMQFVWVGDGMFRLLPFDVSDLVWSLLLVLSILAHVVANARPLTIALGVARSRSRALDLAIAFAILCAIMVVAFVSYFRVWSVV